MIKLTEKEFREIWETIRNPYNNVTAYSLYLQRQNYKKSKGLKGSMF